MNLADRVAASLNLVSGAWAAVLALAIQGGCPAGGCPSPLLQSLLPLIGVAMVLDSILCFVGFRLAFPVGALLGISIAGISLFNFAEQASGFYASLAFVSLVAIVLDLIVIRSRQALSEQGNPMNLPVFG